MRPVVVIGDGASGVLATVALVHCGAGSVVTIGDGPRPGAGLAYRTTEPLHLLNARASTMSALADAPDDLIAWARSAHRPVAGTSFLPRRRYGAYLADRFGAVRGVDRVIDRAVAVRPDASGIEVVLASGRHVAARAVVLAVGHGPPRLPAVPGLCQCPGVLADPWRGDRRAPPAASGQVLLLGTGLTAVDAALSLHRWHPELRLHAVSRHGLLPAAHRPEPCPPVAFRESPDTVAELLRAVRQAVTRTPDWQGVIDGLRLEAGRLWAGLPVPERRRFLAHVDRYWQVHRHRMAPPVATAIAGLRDSGVLQVSSGRLVEVAPGRRGIVATLADGSTLHCDYLVNCTGPGSWARCADPLAVSLRRSGLARLDSTGVGLRCAGDGRLPGTDRLFTLGPPRLGESWETTAIPEIRAQARTIADAITALPRHGRVA